MNEYTRLNLRVRFLKGFSASALEDLNTKIFCRMGALGMASKKFPLTNQLLMSSDILTSEAFSRSKDIEQVPGWRDGASGRALQALWGSSASSKLRKIIHGVHVISSTLPARRRRWST